ncbi:TolC family protein [Yunchengibacter salinarum]|uniref:TolC family protein n=1 Tax=Yunchengibacter salinarum TaxID=3133399 RepID=UPI0035B5E8A2
MPVISRLAPLGPCRAVGLLSFILVLLVWNTLLNHAVSGQAPEKSGPPPLALSDLPGLIDPSDPALEAHRRRAAAARAEARAAKGLPDPTVQLGVLNAPVNDFDLSREAMTQTRVSVHQSFPRGDSRRFRADGARAQARGHGAEARLAYRMMLRRARRTYADWWYADARARLLSEEQALLAEMEQQAQTDMANRASDLARLDEIRLDRALLADQLAEARQDRAVARASLARQVAQASERSPARQPPRIGAPPPLASLRPVLDQHPLVRVHRADMAAAQARKHLKQQDFKPGFGVTVGYGRRTGNRPDFATGLLTVTVPFWTGDKQEPALDSARRAAAAARLDMDGTRRDLAADLAAAHARLGSLNDRARQFESGPLARAQALVDSRRSAYGDRTQAYQAVLAARRRLVAARLAWRGLQADMIRSAADLAYLVPEAVPLLTHRESNPGESQ